MKSFKIIPILVIVSLLIPYLPSSMSLNGGSSGGGISILEGNTLAFGGGRYVEIRYGDVAIGAIYGNRNYSNHLIIYHRALNSVKVLEKKEGGRVVKKSVVNEETLVYEDISSIIEFKDVNNNSRFDAIVENNNSYVLTYLDYPIGGVEIKKPIYRNPVKHFGKNNASVDLLFVLRNPIENLRWSDLKGKMDEIKGERIAKKIAFRLNLSLSVSDSSSSLPVYSDSELCGFSEEDGRLVKSSVRMSMEINGWKYRNNYSKVFLEKNSGFLRFYEERNTGESADDFYVNISTSNPRYLHIEGKNVSKPHAVYGHELRFYLRGKRIGQIKGDKFYMLNGENKSYFDILTDDFEESLSFMGKLYKGFSVSETVNYGHGNISYSEESEISSFIASGNRWVDATPFWASIAPFEVSAIIVISLVFVVKRSHSKRYP